jgi:hypothetical protein
MRIELNCAECGSNRFSLDQGNSDRSLIICQDCGHEIGTLAKLKQMLADEVMRRSAGSEPEDLSS